MMGSYVATEISTANNATFDEPVALRATNWGRLVPDPFELQEELVGVVIRPATELPPIIAQDHRHHRAMVFEEGQHL
jgi:hypothetical protein